MSAPSFPIIEIQPGVGVNPLNLVAVQLHGTLLVLVTPAGGQLKSSFASAEEAREVYDTLVTFRRARQVDAVFAEGVDPPPAESKIILGGE